MDYGFGTSPFGLNQFGRADSAQGAVWFRSIPQSVRLQDAEESGDLEALISPFIDELRRIHTNSVSEMLDGLSAVTARASSEHRLTLAVSSVVNDPGTTIKRVILTDTPGNKAALLEMWPASKPTTSFGVIDGWRALIDSSLYVITKVRADELYFEVRTTQDIASEITVQPPDLLSLLGAARGMIVDRQDPVPFTRRALYRHTLIRDLKVCARLFRLIGLLYGLVFEVSALYCISLDWYNAIVASSPANAFEIPQGSGHYYTDLVPYGIFFDEIPADVVPLDTSEDVDFSLEVTVATNTTGNTWCLDVAVADRGKLLNILKLGHWSFIDADGNAYWIESVDASVGFQFCVLSLGAPTLGVGTLRLKVREVCPPGYKAAAAYRIVITPGEVLTVAGADLARVYSRAEEKINFYTPTHIRLLSLVFTARQSNTISAIAGVSGQDTINDGIIVPVFETETFDAVAADAQPLDTGAFVVILTSTIT